MTRDERPSYTYIPSPRYFCTNSDPTTRMNDASVCDATACNGDIMFCLTISCASHTLASIVLPHPGGPYMRTPRGGSIPIYNTNDVQEDYIFPFSQHDAMPKRCSFVERAAPQKTDLLVEFTVSERKLDSFSHLLLLHVQTSNVCIRDIWLK